MRELTVTNQSLKCVKMAVFELLNSPTFVSRKNLRSPQNLREIAKIVLPKRKVLPLPEGAKMLLKKMVTIMTNLPMSNVIIVNKQLQIAKKKNDKL